MNERRSCKREREKELSVSVRERAREFRCTSTSEEEINRGACAGGRVGVTLINGHSPQVRQEAVHDCACFHLIRGV